MSSREPAQNVHGGRPRRVRPEEQLARWGAHQHRQVTTAQLAAVGWSSSVIAKRVAAGRLHPVHAEVYSLGGPPRTDRERWMAATLTYGPHARLSDSAAAELHGWIRYPLREIHVTTATERKPRDGIVPHFRATSTRWQTIDFIPVTSPEQTILDCAATLEQDKLLRRIIRQAQAERATSHARLLVLNARNAGARGSARLRAELQDGPAPTRSANEDRVRELLERPGRLLTNHLIGGDEVDVYLPDHDAVIEVQSDLHDNPAARKHDAAKRARLEARGLTVHELW